jgi:hypothetical protein
MVSQQQYGQEAVTLTGLSDLFSAVFVAGRLCRNYTLEKACDALDQLFLRSRIKRAFSAGSSYFSIPHVF